MRDRLAYRLGRGFARASVARRTLALGGMLAAGCGGSLPSPAVVEKLRLLAMTTDTPDVRAGADESVRAVWADGKAHAGQPVRSVYFLWRLCALRADNDARICLRRDRGVDLRTATAAEGGDLVTISANDRRNADPLLGVDDTEPSDAEYVLMLAMCPDAAPVFDPVLNVYACPSEASVPNVDREGIMAVRRLQVRDAQTPESGMNHNPVFARAGLAPFAAGDGGVGGDAGVMGSVVGCPEGSLDQGSCQGVHLYAVAAAGSVETRADGMKESLLASFFVSAGSMDRPRAVANAEGPAGAPPDMLGLGLDNSMNATWFPPATPGPVTIWISLRDGRGGESIESFVVDVR